jgi:hypothetical protein
MSARDRRLFLALILAQALHSVEEYVFRLWEVLAPARWVATRLALDPALGFAAANTALVAFGLWCYAARVRPGRSSAAGWAWSWAALEFAYGSAHLALAARACGYFPGAATAPLLLAVAAALGWGLAHGDPDGGASLTR